MLKKIKKLLESKVSDDIILAMELMRAHLTTSQIEDVMPGEEVADRGNKPVAFKLNKESYIVYNNNWMWKSTISELDKKDWVLYLGEHHELKNKDNV